MKQYLFIFCIFVINNLFAQPFSVKNTIDESLLRSPRNTFAVDIDGDGNKDILTLCFFKKNLFWQKSINGAEEFGTINVISEQPSEKIISAYPGDMDGDGDIDIIFADDKSFAFGWFENTDGLGDFSVRHVIGYESRPVYVSAVDLDNDGDLDFLGGGNISHQVLWYENLDGLGNFGTETLISSEVHFLRSIETADLDNDGDLDIISGSSLDNKVAWYENTGNGNFGVQNILSEEIDAAGVILPTDLDADGDLDILVGCYDDFKISYFRNDNGTYNFSDEIIVTEDIGRPNTLVVYDYDIDGDMDILYGTSGGVFLAEKDGANYLDGGSIDDSFICSHITLADIDGDDYSDLIFTSTGAARVFWRKNIVNQQEFGLQQTIVDTPFSGVRNVETMDWDGDGDMDILTKTIGGVQVLWYEKIEAEPYYEEHVVLFPSNISMSGLNPVDIDGDGDMDFITYFTTQQQMGWLENSGNPTNELIPHFLGEYVINFVLKSDTGAGDLDGDGDMDIVYRDYQLGYIYWYENLGETDGFSSKQFVANVNGNYDSAVRCVDMDNDGDLDILTGTSPDNYIFLSWIENTDGAGNFNTVPFVIQPDYRIDLFEEADLDEDGDLDVFFWSSIDDVFGIEWNTNGLGTQWETEILASNSGVYDDIEITDLDSDGISDLLCLRSNVDNSGLLWFKGQETLGTYSETNYSSLGLNYAGTLNVIDVDSDGTTDLICSNNTFGELVWFSNEIILPLNASISFDNNPLSCKNDADAVAYVQVIGGQEPFSIEWSTGDDTFVVNDLSMGSYSYTITDANDEIFQETIIITEPEEVLEFLDFEILPEANGQENGSITVNLLGGVAPFLFEWSNGMTGETIQNLAANFYTVTVTDAYGCSIMQEVEVSLLSNNENVNTIDLQIFPNPTKDFLNISTADISHINSCALNDLNGNIILKTKGSPPYKLDLSTFPNGVYILKIYFQDNTTSNKKVVIARS